jgi:hypothetical protein
LTCQNERTVSAFAPRFVALQSCPRLSFDSVRQDPRAMAASITQAEYDSLISRLAAVEEENAATLLEVDT